MMDKIQIVQYEIDQEKEKQTMKNFDIETPL